MNKLLPALAATCIFLTSAAFAGVSQAKLAAVGTQVSIDGVATHLDEDGCYIQAEDRASGIWVAGATTGLHIGDVVSATGTLSRVNGEVCIADASIASQGRQAMPRPFSMNNRTINHSYPGASVYDYLRVRIPGDGHEWKWAKAGGLSNAGLLIKTWGTVKSVYHSPTSGTRWFYIDDGSRCVSDYGDIGVLVYADSPVNQGDFVAVTGVSGVEPSFDDPGRLVRVIRTRDDGDVSVLKEYQLPEYPFSDEFSGNALDARWIVYTPKRAVAPTVQAGLLTLAAPAPNRENAHQTRSPVLSQKLRGDWAVEMKVTVDVSAVEELVDDYVYIAMQSNAMSSLPSQFAVFPLATVKSLCAFPPSIARRTDVTLGSSGPTFPLSGNTLYFRFACRSGMMYANLSFDGVVYQTEEITLGTNPLCDFLSFSLSASGESTAPFTMHMDYLRYTNLTQGDI